MEYQKTKSASKTLLAKGPRLSKIVLDTLAQIRAIVGATLGPNGCPVLIERYEHNLPPIVSKDGVTVFRALGFEGAGAQVVLEAARDAAVKTANEAGDGTTTSTVLSEAIVRYMNHYCTKNPTISPQKVVRELDKLFRNIIEPTLKAAAVPAKNNTAVQKMVANVSTNNDVDLTEAVMSCFDEVGDEGNVALVERSGPSGYEIEKLDGYPLTSGYEDSCGKFYTKFINDAGNQRVFLEKPVFLLYHGTINDIQTIYSILIKFGNEFVRSTGQAEDGSTSDYAHHNLVIMATGFSESVLATLANNFGQKDTFNAFTYKVPLSPQANGQKQFLDDIAAFTGADIFDPISNPVNNAELQSLGPGVESFEANRFRGLITGRAEGPYLGFDKFETHEERILARANVLMQQIRNPESQLDHMLNQERLGKLTGGIAKLHIIGSSNGEIKEKKDRAEDAICAVRGALKAGTLPGGGWGLLKVCSVLDYSNPIVGHILGPALYEPILCLLANCGLSENEAREVLAPVEQGIKDGKKVIYDAYYGRHGDAYELGVLDSVPAVLEAIRNALSIASLLGTLGGFVVFGRNDELEKQEALKTADWLRDANAEQE